MRCIELTPCRKVYVCGRRLHHGLAGLVFMAAGFVAFWHDRRDWPFPLKDR